MPVSVSLSVKVQKGKEIAFEEFCKGRLGETKVYEGCLFVNFGKDDENSSHYRIISEWETKNHLQNYIKWRTDTGFIDELVSFLSEPPVITNYTLVWGRHFHM